MLEEVGGLLKEVGSLNQDVCNQLEDMALLKW